MSQIYMVRHQAHGVFAEVAFRSPPTKKQLEQLAEYFESKHGKAHKKSGAPLWTKYQIVPVLGPDDDVPAKVLGKASEQDANEASAPKFEVSGTGRVTPPK